MPLTSPKMSSKPWKIVEKSWAVGWPMPLRPGEPVLVVGLALAIVGEDLVGLGGLLELLLRALVIGIAVGVVLDGELPVGFLYFLPGGVFLNAQDLVKVTLGHCL